MRWLCRLRAGAGAAKPGHAQGLKVASGSPGVSPEPHSFNRKKLTRAEPVDRRSIVDIQALLSSTRRQWRQERFWPLWRAIIR